MPFFSVIVPVHNKMSHIQGTLLSVLNQTFADFELLVIDDASTDGSALEIQKITDPRMRVLYRDTPGPGGYAARNLGIRESIADWITFLDADDQWHPDHLQVFYEKITCHPSIKIFSSGWIDYYGADQSRLGGYLRVKPNGTDRVFTFFDFCKMSSYGHHLVWTGVICVHKLVFKETGLFPEGRCSRGGDVETWLRIMYETQRGYWIGRPLTTYFRQAENMVTSKGKLEIVNPCIRDTVEKMICKAKNLKEKRALKRFENSFMKFGLYQHIKIGTLTFRKLKAFHASVEPLFFLLLISTLFIPRVVMDIFSRMKNR